MADQDPDQPVHMHIEHLVNEEHRLREEKSLPDSGHERLKAVETELDQRWNHMHYGRGVQE